MKTRNLFYATVLATAALCVGCSSNVKLTGTVSFSDDGAPVESGPIYFVSGDTQGRGSIVDGKFETTFGDEDGLPPGDYQVYFVGVEKVVRESETLGDGSTTDPVTAPAIDAKYLSAETSGLTQKVDKSTKTVDFKLDRNPEL